jgi:hypothetical protein
MRLSYLIRRVPAEFKVPIDLNDWDDPAWQNADELQVGHFHPQSSDHRPRTRARLLHDQKQLFLRFDVEDRYVVSRAMQFQQPVYCDSCVEFFVQPKPTAGYFNIEMNCGGALLMYYIEDPKRTGDGFAKYTPIRAEDARQLVIHHSMPSIVDPERVEPTIWRIGAIIPTPMLESYVGALGDPAGQAWRGNFYKCAEKSSHPHWASWSPIGQTLNFHQPEFFGELRFGSSSSAVRNKT